MDVSEGRKALHHRQELRRIYNDLIMVYKIFHGLVNVNANELINVKISTSTRGHRFKLQTSQFKRDDAKNQFCNRDLAGSFFCEPLCGK